MDNSRDVHGSNPSTNCSFLPDSVYNEVYKLQVVQLSRWTAASLLGIVHCFTARHRAPCMVYECITLSPSHFHLTVSWFSVLIGARGTTSRMHVLTSHINLSLRHSLNMLYHTTSWNRLAHTQPTFGAPLPYRRRLIVGKTSVQRQQISLQRPESQAIMRIAVRRYQSGSMLLSLS